MVYDVTSYGATGNGTTDDTAAINAAMAAVPAAGGVVYFPAGTYRTTSTIGLPQAPTTLRGDGIDASVLKVDADVDGIWGSYSAFYTQRLAVRDLTIATTVTNGTKKAIRVEFPTAASVNECTLDIRDVSIRPFGHTVNDQRWDVGVHVENAWNARLVNVHVHGANNQWGGMSYGIHLLGASNDAIVRDCDVFGATIGVLVVVGGNQVTSQSGAHGYTVVISSGSNYCAVTGNTRQNGVATVSNGGTGTALAGNL